MSEKISTARLAEFNKNKVDKEAETAAQERAAFEESLYAGSLNGEFTDEDEKRVKEAAEYEEHLARMADPDYVSTTWGGTNEAGSWEKRTDISGVSNEAYEQEQARIKAEKQKRAEDEALQAKLASNPDLAMMDRVSSMIDKLSNKSADPEKVSDEEVAEHNAKISQLEDHLQALLEKYEQSDKYDPAIADMLIDREDKAARARAGANALAGRIAADKAPRPKLPPSLDQSLLIPPTAEEVAEREARLRERVAEAEAAAAGEGTLEPMPYSATGEEGSGVASWVPFGDPSRRTEGSTSTPAGEEGKDDVLVASGGNPASEHNSAGFTPGGLEEYSRGRGEGETPSAADDEILSGLALRTPEDNPDEKPLRGPFKRLRQRMAMRKAERMTGEDKERRPRGRRLAVIVGAAAVAAGALALGADSTHSSHEAPQKSDKEASAPSNTRDRQDIVQAKQDKNQTEQNEQDAGTYETPWAWAKSEFGESNAMQQLYKLGDKASKHGHDVKWYGQRGGKHEWVRVDGNDNPKEVIKVLKQYENENN